MFIKFSDKTKKIIVKTSKDEYDDPDSEEIDILSAEADAKKDRRVHILKEIISNKLCNSKKLHKK
jgi:hypothetical protein